MESIVSNVRDIIPGFCFIFAAEFKRMGSIIIIIRRQLHVKQFNFKRVMKKMMTMAFVIAIAFTAAANNSWNTSAEPKFPEPTQSWPSEVAKYPSWPDGFEPAQSWPSEPAAKSSVI